MSAGRIDIDEYGERSARMTAAKTRAELAGLSTTCRLRTRCTAVRRPPRPYLARRAPGFRPCSQDGNGPAGRVERVYAELLVLPDVAKLHRCWK